jgi:hypothetical protein
MLVAEKVPHWLKRGHTSVTRAWISFPALKDARLFIEINSGQILRQCTKESFKP